MFKQDDGMLQWHEIGNAPAGPRLYAWYFIPQLSAANVASQEDSAASLERIARQLVFPRLQLQMKGHFSLLLQGAVSHAPLGSRDQLFPMSLARVLDTDRGRRLLADVLRSTIPRLAAPLYIGISSSLRSRLSQHKALIRKLKTSSMQELPDSPDGADTRERDHSFAAAVVDREIDPNHLVVCALGLAPATSDDLTSSEVRAMVEGVETLLNRLYYPILGRR